MVLTVYQFKCNGNNAYDDFNLTESACIGQCTDTPTTPTNNPICIFHPTAIPTIEPSILPSSDPSTEPTGAPTISPTGVPTTYPAISRVFTPWYGNNL